MEILYYAENKQADKTLVEDFNEEAASLSVLALESVFSFLTISLGQAFSFFYLYCSPLAIKFCYNPV